MKLNWKKKEKLKLNNLLKLRNPKKLMVLVKFVHWKLLKLKIVNKKLRENSTKNFFIYFSIFL